MKQALLLAETFVWQWHGRQMFMEVRNDFRFRRRLRRVVYHLADVCEAADEKAAVRIFKRSYPESQTTSLFCVGPKEEDE